MCPVSWARRPKRRWRAESEKENRAGWPGFFCVELDADRVPPRVVFRVTGQWLHLRRRDWRSGFRRVRLAQTSSRRRYLQLSRGITHRDQRIPTAEIGGRSEQLVGQKLDSRDTRINTCNRLINKLVTFAATAVFRGEAKTSGPALGKALHILHRSLCTRPRAEPGSGRPHAGAYSSRRPSIAFSMVISSVYSMSLPTGMPMAMRVTFTPVGLSCCER